METNANQKGVSCMVNYSYDASEPDELTLRVGDVVRDVERLSGGWWRGELRGRRGMFPDNFVTVLNEHGTGTGRSTVQGRCRAVFSYQPANPDELPLCVGDVLDVLGEVEEGWWQGRRQGRVGVFPSNFVVMLDPPQPAATFEPAPALPPKPVKEQCRVLFPYTAVNDDELTLAEGDIVTIISKEAPDRGWWRGELHGRQGLFPDNFVQIVPPVRDIVSKEAPDRGWWRRELHGRQGLFPDNFVQIVPPVRDIVSKEAPDRGWWRGELHGRQGLFPDNFVQIVPPAGDIVSKEAPDRGWWRGELHGRQGLFPDNFVQIVPPVRDIVSKEAPDRGWWRGELHGRQGLFPDNFVQIVPPAGDIVSKEAPDRGWWRGELHGRQGLFPDNFVQIVPPAGDIVSKEAPDRGWWRGELHGRQGLFPDNFVQIVPPDECLAQEVEEKKPERPPSKTGNSIYPILNKYSEKTASVKELTTSKISLHKENTVSKESSTQSTVTHTNKSESEKLIHSETVSDGTLDGVKKPPVPLKKSPTPTTGVGGLFSGLKSKILPPSDNCSLEKSPTPTTGVGGLFSGLQSKILPPSDNSSSGEWDRLDGAAHSYALHTNTNTFDHVERHSILNDPRAGRVKAPRRRPPSQAFRDDAPPPTGLSNGHEANSSEKPPPTESAKAEEIKPRAREWEKHRAPWMEELKLNQAKKTSFGADGKSRSVSSSDTPAAKQTTGSTDRNLDKHRAPWMEELKLNQAKKTSFGADGKSRSVSSSDTPAAKYTGSTDR
ncbi:variant SH3 domain-containing protein [Phthorimaea operculella]|nr:variant SH3 domain-containing protein [Phthorimaea operculella]